MEMEASFLGSPLLSRQVWEPRRPWWTEAERRWRGETRIKGVLVNAED